ncbi:MAG: DnaK suppressor protein [Cognaticolwellia sp.]|jgi:DnaK suppressor protein
MIADEKIPLPDDEYLSREELMHLNGVLQDQAELLLTANRQNISHLTDQREVDADAVDQASNESDRGFSLRLADRDRLMLKKIQSAQSRMFEGEYGSCEGCGEPIGYHRQLARPVATQCIDCKTSAEQSERRSWQA